jgi:hypothetical protein
VLKRPLFLASMLILLLPQTMHAQTPVVIDGLQVIAERQYATDPGLPIDTQDEGVYLVSARVYLFNSQENAESTWETLVAAESIEQDLPADDDSMVYEKTELENVGDRATVLSLSAEMDKGETGAFRTVVIQQDAMIVTVTAIASSVDAATVADDIAIAMIEREPADTESEYDGLGGSTGSVWEVFLPADAEELGDLTAYADKETRPVQT